VLLLLLLPADLANVICTIFFVSGIITLLQTFIGDRSGSNPSTAASSEP
jgi:xanthine/uracil permease